MSAAQATDPLVSRYLDHVRFEKRLAERTCTLYQLDLARLADMAAASGVPLLQVQNGHIRRWVAQMHSAGRSGRGIALILSGWRGFYTWLGREGLVAQTRWPMCGPRVWPSPCPRRWVWTKRCNWPSTKRPTTTLGLKPGMLRWSSCFMGAVCASPS
jgi:hypothetical protein